MDSLILSGNRQVVAKQSGRSSSIIDLRRSHFRGRTLPAKSEDIHVVMVSAVWVYSVYLFMYTTKLYRQMTEYNHNRCTVTVMFHRNLFGLDIY